MTRRILPALLILGLSLPLMAQEKEALAPLPPGIAWQPDFEAAIKLARTTNRPLMLAFLIKGESANDEVMRGHFKNKKIIKMSRKFVCLACCLGLKEVTEGIRADGTKGLVSTVLGSATPNEIASVEIKARGAYMDSPTISAPQFLFVKPDARTVLLRHVWMLSASALLKKMEIAYAYFDPSFAPKGFKAHKDHVTQLLIDAESNNEGTRRAALKTLATVDDPRILTFLIKQTGSRAGVVKKKEAIFYMRVKGNAKALPRLHKLLKAKDSQTRLYTAVALEGIGMQESTLPLLNALKREMKERVKTHLLRAFAGCCVDEKELEKVVLKSLRNRGQLVRIAALRIGSSLTPSPALKKALLKSMKDSSSQVRSAAYLCVGTLRMMEAKKPILARVERERGEAKACALWALEQLGWKPFEGDEDPETIVRDLLPDNYLYDGYLEDPNPNRRQGGGGRGGGGRRGGGGGRR